MSCNGRVVGQEALLICRTAPPDRIVKLNTGFIIGFVFCLRLGRVHGYIIVNVKFMFHVRLSLPFPVACIALGTLVAGQHVCSACWQLLGWYAPLDHIVKFNTRPNFGSMFVSDYHVLVTILVSSPTQVGQFNEGAISLIKISALSKALFQAKFLGQKVNYFQSGFS